MADENIGRLVAKLNRAIENGVDLFKDYKKLSKKFQEGQKILMNSPELKKEFANLKKKYDEGVKIAKAQKNATSKTATLKSLKNTYDKQLNLIQKKSELSEIYLVNYDKKFLTEKKKISDKKNIILKNILEIGKEIKFNMSEEDFNDFIKRMYKIRYEVLDNKTISFKTLMHHLESGQVSENVAKTTKQIDKLMTIGNVINRKKNMETGILKKEIEKLLKDYDKTMISLKKIASTKFPNKNITNEDIESLLQTKYSKENSIEIKETINKLATDLRILNSKIKIKMQELKKLQES